MVAEWKAQREAEAGIDAPALAGLTDERLVGLIEKALASISPQRLLTVELGLGVAARGQTIILPTETAKDYFEMYAEQGPAVLVLTVRSVGELKASVDVRGREKVPACGQVEVLAGGQLKVPTPRSPCRPGV